MVGFLIGCSYTFEGLLVKEGLAPKHVKLGRNVAMYKTNLDTKESNFFKGKMIVSMRPYKQDQIQKVIELTNKFPRTHGAPIHWNGNY